MEPKARFSSRVADYVKYRPGYPAGLVPLMRERCGLDATSAVADIGSGTGLLTHLFLENGCRVYGVEPNPEMRRAGEDALARYPRFASVAASAEATGLPDRSVDFVAAGQAFHWFDRGPARGEFARILKPGGWLVLVWNTRKTGAAGTAFERAYEQLLLDCGTDYEAVRHSNIDLPAIQHFAGSAPVAREELDNQQTFALEGILGRLRSSSYTPEPGHPGFEPMMARAREIFAAHQRDGKVIVTYDTEVYVAQIGAT